MSAAIESLVDLADPAGVAVEIGRINTLIAQRATVPDEAWQLVSDMMSGLENLDVARWGAIDPYLQAVFFRGFAQATRALEARAASESRELLRLGLERMRHALEEMAETSRTGDERNPKELVKWLWKTVPVSQAELAGVLGVERRKLQRWLNEGQKPEGDDAMRVIAVARIVNQLRHSFTPVGVLRWFSRPRPELGGKRPQSLLKNPEEIPRLWSLAASVRHSDAA